MGFLDNPPRGCLKRSVYMNFDKIEIEAAGTKPD